jgi:hypothetical protein
MTPDPIRIGATKALIWQRGWMLDPAPMLRLPPRSVSMVVSL